MPNCTNCGEEYGEGQRFCGNCGRAVGEDAPPIPPEQGRIETPSQPVPPPPQGGLQRFKEGWQGTGQEGTRFSEPTAPSQSEYQQRGPGVWSGVKIGCGMFIVLPILIIVGILVLFVLMAALGSSG